MFLDDTYVGLRRNGASGAETFCDLDAVLSTQRIVMVAVRHSQLTAEASLAATTAGFGGVGVASFAGLGAVDISPQGTTKAVGAAEEMTESGCPANATVVLGDMPNDLPLFSWAGWACAMANGHPEVVAAADEVVSSNDDDGVARSVHVSSGSEKLRGRSREAPPTTRRRRSHIAGFVRPTGRRCSVRGRCLMGSVVGALSIPSSSQVESSIVWLRSGGIHGSSRALDTWIGSFGW